MFETHAPAAHPHHRQAGAVSLATHLVVVVALLWGFGTRHEMDAATARSPLTGMPLVWRADPRPSGGGGGGGAGQATPAAQLRRAGRDSRSLPSRLPAPTPTPASEPLDTPVEPVATLAVAPLAAAFDAVPGVVTAQSPEARGLGNGSGAGAGGGDGLGTGPGNGSGVGDGRDGNTGGGIYQPGGDVSAPRVLKVVQPRYTTEAMRARRQGAVLIAAVVRENGGVSDLRILRSLDRQDGLDEEALKAAREWRFEPGRRAGKPVPVWVTIELSFRLH